MGSLKKFGKLFDWINRFFVTLSCILVAFDMLLVCSDIALREFADYSIPGADEISEYTLLYITFLAAAWLLKQDGHIRMDMFLTRLNTRSLALINTITSLMGALTCLILACYSADTTLDQFVRSAYRATTLEVPVALLIVIIPIGSFMLFIEFVRAISQYLKSWRTIRGEQKIVEKPIDTGIGY